MIWVVRVICSVVILVDIAIVCYAYRNKIGIFKNR